MINMNKNSVLPSPPAVPLTERQMEIAAQLFSIIDGRSNVHFQLKPLAEQIGLHRVSLYTHLPKLTEAFPQLSYIPYRGLFLRRSA